MPARCVGPARPIAGWGRRIAGPDSRPAGSARGWTPPTAQRSVLRGVNGTVTRAPGAKVVVSAAWATASWYWIVGRRLPCATACGRPAGGVAATVPIGAGPARTHRPAPVARARGRPRRTLGALGKEGGGGAGVTTVS